MAITMRQFELGSETSSNIIVNIKSKKNDDINKYS